MVESKTSEHKELEHRKLWEQYWDDPETSNAIYELMETWLPLVHSVTERMSIRLPSHVVMDDLLQMGVIGLYHAIERFDPQKGMSFKAYAYPRVRGAILDELRAQDHVSRSRRSQIKKMEATARAFTDKHRRPPKEEELAKELEINLSELEKIMDSAQPWLSLEETISKGAGDEVTLRDLVADPSSTIPDEEAVRHDMCHMLHQAFMNLSPREQKIMYLYYFEELRLSEIAELYDLSEARISQIHTLAITRLRAVINQRENE